MSYKPSKLLERSIVLAKDSRSALEIEIGAKEAELAALETKLENQADGDHGPLILEVGNFKAFSDEDGDDYVYIDHPDFCQMQCFEVTDLQDACILLNKLYTKKRS